jgi:hypothetical protein
MAIFQGKVAAPYLLTAHIHRTQEWLAASDDPEALASGGYWHHQHREKPHHAVRDERFQNELLDHLASVTGERLRDPTSRPHTKAVAFAGDPVAPVMFSGLMVMKASHWPALRMCRARGPSRHSSPRGMPSLARSCWCIMPWSFGADSR